MQVDAPCSMLASRAIIHEAYNPNCSSHFIVHMIREAEEKHWSLTELPALTVSKEVQRASEDCCVEEQKVTHPRQSALWEAGGNPSLIQDFKGDCVLYCMVLACKCSNSDTSHISCKEEYCIWLPALSQRNFRELPWITWGGQQGRCPWHSA